MIRTYRPADGDAVLDVWARASAVAHAFLSSDFLAQERRNIVSLYLPVAETWVWEEHGSVVGFIALLGNEIGAIFVDPGFQRAGIGQALLAHARLLKEDLEVEVFARNLLGRAFYKKAGFDLLQRRVHDETGFEILRLGLAAAKQPAADGGIGPPAGC